MTQFKLKRNFLAKMIPAGMAALLFFNLLAAAPALAANASNPADIGREQAEQIALEQAGLTTEDVSRLRTVQDWENGSLEYEVEFFTEETEYDYTIDGETGTIWEESQEVWQRGNQADSDVGSEVAQDAALDHAELTLEDTQNLRVHKELDDGYLEYEVWWLTDSYEYEYIIDGAGGTVWQWDKKMLPEARQAVVNGTSEPAAVSTGDIGAEAARDAALAKAGLTLDQVTQMHIEWETTDDYFNHHGSSHFEHSVYEISFRHGGQEYDCVVDCATGEVLEYEHEFDD